MQDSCCKKTNKKKNKTKKNEAKAREITLAVIKELFIILSICYFILFYIILHTCVRKEKKV